MRGYPFALPYVGFLISLLAIASIIAARDDQRSALSLAVLTPAVDALMPAATRVAREARTLIAASAAIVAAILMVTATRAVRRPDVCFGWVTASAMALAGQAALIWGQSELGAALYGLAVAAVLFGRLRGENLPAAGEALVDRRESFLWGEAAALAGITLVAVFFRFYALNRVVHYFEGELSPYMVAATSLRGMIFANVGDRGPWAPLGYFYYLPIFLTTHLFGSTILAVRLASALVSVLSIPLLYALVRRCAGREAAIIAAFFVALDPLQIGWGRSDIHPHGSTVWITILLCWATLSAAEGCRPAVFAAVAVLMGLSVHQYPSGQAAFLIPWVFGAWCLAIRDAPKGFVSVAGVAALAAGVALWVVGFLLPYRLAYGEWRALDVASLWGVRVSWYGAESLDRWAAINLSTSRAYANLLGLLSGLWVKAPMLHLQDLIPPYPTSPPVPVRSIIWPAAALATVTSAALLLERHAHRTRLLLSWAFVSALPLIFSDGSYPKRASNLFPALYALAAVGIVALRHSLTLAWGRRSRWLAGGVEVVATALFFLASLHQWFSGNVLPYGEPRDVAIARAIAPRLEPGTIVIGDLRQPSQPSRTTFLLLDRLREVGDVVWWTNPDVRSPSPPLHEASRLLAGLPDSLWYRWSDLHDDLPRIQAYRSWSKVVLLSQTDGNYPEENGPIEERLREARSECPDGEYVMLRDEGPDLRFQLFECRLTASNAPASPR